MGGGAGVTERWLFLVFGSRRSRLSVCISLASIVPILVCILPLVLVLWESTPLALVLYIGPVLITATPAVPVRTSKFVSQAFRFQCFICTFE